MCITRFLDILITLILLIVLTPLFFFFYILCFFETYSPIFKQERIGRDKKLFILYKYRTMSVNTKNVSTHLVDPDKITRFGRYMRKFKIDELPQLINVLKGDMSLVGPRPNLPNQYQLILERDNKKIYKVRPGITGLAQVQGVDMSNPKLLAEMDARMLATYNLRNYFRYILLTLIGNGTGDRIAKC